MGIYRFLPLEFKTQTSNKFLSDKISSVIKLTLLRITYNFTVCNINSPKQRSDSRKSRHPSTKYLSARNFRSTHFSLTRVTKSLQLPRTHEQTTAVVSDNVRAGAKGSKLLVCVANDQNRNVFFVEGKTKAYYRHV